MGAVSPFKAVAQTDVTSTYLTNANLEDSYTVHTYPREDGDNKRAIYKPEGWAISYSNGESNDLSALNSDCYGWSNFSNRQQPVNGGNKVYWIRFRWGSSATIKLSQTVSMPAGTYRLSADAFWISSSSTATLSAGGQSVTIDSRNAWANYGVVFTLSATTDVEIAYTFKQTAQAECIAGVDNFKIESFDQSTTDLTWVWTELFSNPSFELGTDGSFSGNSEGWANRPRGFSGSLKTGWTDGALNTTNPSNGSNCYNLWSNTFESSDIYQDIVLPMGKYTITADMRIDNMSNVNDQGVYAKVGDETYKSGTITSVAGTWNSMDGWNTLSKTFYVPSDNATVRLGVSSSGTGNSTVGWYQVDNFTLTYHGSVTKLATNITLGQATSLTPGKWYSLNVGTTDYQFNSTSATTIYYTLNGYESPGDVTTSLELSAGNTIKELSDGTLCFRTTTATTLTISAISYAEGQDLTSIITNPGFESNGAVVNLSSSNLTGVTGWTLATVDNTNDVGTRAYSDNTYATLNGVGDYCFNCYWEGKPLTQSLGTLPAGTYELSALVTTGNGSSMGTVYLNANNDHSTGCTRKNATANYYQRERLVFTVTETSPVTIGIRGGNDAENGASKGAYNENGYWWYKCDDFQLTYLCKPTQANLYNKLHALVTNCAPWTTSGEYYSAYQTYSGYTASNTVDELTAAINYLTNEYERHALASATNSRPYDMNLIANPSYSDGQTSWSDNRSATGSGSISISSDNTQTNYFNSSFNTWMHHSDVYQEGIIVDEGIYRLSAKMKGTPKDDESTFIYATTGNVNYWGTLFSGTTYNGYLTQVAASSWSTIDIYLALDTPAKFRIGAYSWGNNWNGGNGGAFSVDDWKLEKIDYAVVTKNAVVSAYGAAPLADINAALTQDVAAVDLTKATGLSSAAISTSNNSNLLIHANSGQVSNSDNVVVDGTCANLVLVDGYPFVNPKEFTATSATYTMGAVADNKFGTLIIPFPASTLPGSAYTLDQSVDLMDGNIRGTSTASIAANSPVLVTKAGTYSGSGTVPVVASGATYTNGELIGTYTAKEAPEGSYVLQNHTNGEGVAFYLVGTTKPTVNPFRAYIKAQASGARALHVVFDDEAQGITNLNLNDNINEKGCYDLMGRQLNGQSRGIGIVRMSNGSVKKVYVK